MHYPLFQIADGDRMFGQAKRPIKLDMQLASFAMKGKAEMQVSSNSNAVGVSPKKEHFETNRDDPDFSVKIAKVTVSNLLEGWWGRSPSRRYASTNFENIQRSVPGITEEVIGSSLEISEKRSICQVLIKNMNEIKDHIKNTSEKLLDPYDSSDEDSLDPGYVMNKEDVEIYKKALCLIDQCIGKLNLTVKDDVTNVDT